MIDMSWIRRLPLDMQHQILDGAAMKPPPGVKPDFINPPNRNDVGYGMLVAACIITTLLVCGRLYARIVYQKKVAIHDALSIAALGAFGAYVYCDWMVIRTSGFLIHQWDIQLKAMPAVLYWIRMGTTVYGIVIMLLKVTILLQWIELFDPTGIRGGFWWTCQITIWTNVFFYMICIFLEQFGCTPRTKLWDFTLQGHCSDISKIDLSAVFINLFSDVIIFALPQRMIWGLQLSIGRKLGVASLFAVGAVAIASASCKVKSTFDYTSSKDLIYTISKAGYWCIAEIIAGFSVLCLPSIPKLVKSTTWYRRLGTKLRPTGKDCEKRPSSRSKKANTPWPSRTRRRDPDASLFTATLPSDDDFVPLRNMHTAPVAKINGRMTSPYLLNGWRESNNLENRQAWP